MNLLPFTPDTMRSFRQEIVIDTPALLRAAVQKQMVQKLPEMVEGKDTSFLSAFEALKAFRDMASMARDTMTDAEKEMAAEVEVDWCLDILGRLQRAGKIDE